MKLDTEFIQLPLTFDADRLADEVRGFAAEEWSAHPTDFQGNAAIRLISAYGGQNDDIGGPMQATPFLNRCPYVRQVLASFQSVFGRSRFMLLAGHSVVPSHRDVNYHWFTRVRIHVPVITFPEVSFHCDDKQVHMGRGEAWVFDNWRVHMVNNPTPHARIHLVADTAGSATFWDMVESGRRPFGRSTAQPFHAEMISYRPNANVHIDTEKYNVPDVMSPGEIEWLVDDILADLALSGNSTEAVARLEFIRMTKDFVHEWRTIWAQFGREPAGWPHYQTLISGLTDGASRIPPTLLLASNNCRATGALLARVASAALNTDLANDRTAIVDIDASPADYPIDVPQTSPEPPKGKHHQSHRNAPCACGSGKKYKHCHGALT